MIDQDDLALGRVDLFSFLRFDRLDFLHLAGWTRLPGIYLFVSCQVGRVGSVGWLAFGPWVSGIINSPLHGSEASDSGLQTRTQGGDRGGGAS